MDFSFTDEQKLIVDTVGAFARCELQPKYPHWDRVGQFPRELWQGMAGLGLLGLRVPEEYGGQPSDYLTAGLAIEQVAYGDFNICYGLLTCNFAGDLLTRFGSDAVKRDWLPRIASGDKIPCVCLTEPHCGSDAAGIRTRAVRHGGRYVLNGEKASVTLLMVGDAAIVFAKTDLEAGAKGVTAFLVPLDSAGITKHPYEDMGARSIVRGSMFLDAVEVPAENVIGPENGGFTAVMQTFDYTRALIGLMCLGAAQAALDETIAYVKERAAFGKPVSMNQGVSFPIAEWHARIEMARWYCYRTLWLRDHGLPHTKEAAICKFEAPAIATAAIHDCLILHGHYGYTREFPIEQRLRDVIGQEIADGTPQIQKLIVARALLGRAFCG